MNEVAFEFSEIHKTCLPEGISAYNYYKTLLQRHTVKGESDGQWTESSKQELLYICPLCRPIPDTVRPLNEENLLVHMGEHFMDSRGTIFLPGGSNIHNSHTFCKVTRV